jgi:FkbM family methyltransferase
LKKDQAHHAATQHPTVLTGARFAGRLPRCGCAVMGFAAKTVEQKRRIRMTKTSFRHSLPFLRRLYRQRDEARKQREEVLKELDEARRQIEQTPKTIDNARIQIEEGAVKSSWSIEGEDIVSKFLLDHLLRGGKFFIDIGAHHPYRISNTYLFYKHGWRGINVEPNPEYIEEFNNIRPEDLTLNIALSDQSEILEYRRFADSGLNGFFTDDDVKTRVDEGIIYLDSIKVPAISVKEFLNTYVIDKNIDFLNIDIEGFEPRVLMNWDWQLYRPKLICVEMHGPSIEFIQKHEIHGILRREGYAFLSRIWQSSMFGDELALRKMSAQHWQR